MIEKLTKSKLFLLATFLLSLLIFLGLFAPFFASNYPLFVYHEGNIYFPLFRFLFFKGAYTKEIDLFFNALMFAFPFLLLSFLYRRKKKLSYTLLGGAGALCFTLYAVATLGYIKDPCRNLSLLHQKEKASLEKKEKDAIFGEISSPPTWDFDLAFSSDYEKLRQLLLYRRNKKQEEHLASFLKIYRESTQKSAPTLFSIDKTRRDEEKTRLHQEIQANYEAVEKASGSFPLLLSAYKKSLSEFKLAKIEDKENAELRSTQDTELILLEEKVTKEKEELLAAFTLLQKHKERQAALHYLEEREKWLENESHKLFVIAPLFRNFHWEEDAGGGELFNRFIPITDVTRPNRKDLMASLFFGIRISLVVGLGATLLSLAIGLPLGLISGYFGGSTDLALFRFIEIWEAMPSFFMLLLITAVVLSKSIFLIIFILGLFGWTQFARFIRAETLKQRALPYVLASKSLGFSHSKLIFSEIMPNALPPILALLPFAMMGAMTAEAALAFLGLGEENSTSFGVLMSEARAFFPGESYLLWPPAVILTTILVCFALIGDSLRDALSPQD